MYIYIIASSSEDNNNNKNGKPYSLTAPNRWRIWHLAWNSILLQMKSQISTGKYNFKWNNPYNATSINNVCQRNAFFCFSHFFSWVYFFAVLDLLFSVAFCLGYTIEHIFFLVITHRLFEWLYTQIHLLHLKCVRVNLSSAYYSAILSRALDHFTFRLGTFNTDDLFEHLQTWEKF